MDTTRLLVTFAIASEIGCKRISLKFVGTENDYMDCRSVAELLNASVTLVDNADLYTFIFTKEFT